MRKAAVSKHAWRREIRKLLIDGIKQFVGDASDGNTSSPLKRFVLVRRFRSLSWLRMNCSSPRPALSARHVALDTLGPVEPR